MSSSKNKNEVEKQPEEEMEIEIEVEEVKLKPTKKSSTKKLSILDDEGVEEPEILDTKSKAAEKKRREFFGATVFDDEEVTESGNKIEDDILNVPAFFRRKK